MIWACVGVIVAVLLPVLKGLVQGYFGGSRGEAILPEWAKRYLVLLAFGALTAIAVLAVWKSQNPDAQLEWYTAFLLGFTAEATLEKLFQRPAVNQGTR
jgi:hypothetical protein